MSFLPAWVLDQDLSERRRVNTQRTLVSTVQIHWLGPYSQHTVSREPDYSVQIGSSGVGSMATDSSSATSSSSITLSLSKRKILLKTTSFKTQKIAKHTRFVNATSAVLAR